MLANTKPKEDSKGGSNFTVTICSATTYGGRGNHDQGCSEFTEQIAVFKKVWKKKKLKRLVEFKMMNRWLYDKIIYHLGNRSSLADLAGSLSNDWCE